MNRTDTIKTDRQAPTAEFEWRVPKAGFRWEKTAKGQELVENDPAKGYWTVFPLRTNGRGLECLFQIFADTETSAEGIIAFADKYGCLFSDDEHDPPNKYPFNIIGPEE